MKINKHMKKKIAKSLKELYNESLICEMPYMSHDPYDGKDLDDDIKNKKIAEALIEGTLGKLVGNFIDDIKINIYLIEGIQNSNGPLDVYMLIPDDMTTVVGAVNLQEIKSAANEIYTSTCGLWKKSTFKLPIIFNFFIKWLYQNLISLFQIIIPPNLVKSFG